MMFGTQNLDQGCKIVSFRVPTIKFFILAFFGIFGRFSVKFLKISDIQLTYICVRKNYVENFQLGQTSLKVEIDTGFLDKWGRKHIIKGISQ